MKLTASKTAFCLGDKYHAEDAAPALWLKAIESNTENDYQWLSMRII